jgi:DNA-binding SARP family transcriptional activator
VSDPSRAVWLSLLGHPEVELDGAPVRFDTRKALALLAFLAVEGPQRRDRLTALLWPDSDQERGRAALRRTLSAVRSVLGPVALRVTGESVDLDAATIGSDVATFRGLAKSNADLSRAAELHRGDFLAGFTLRDSPEFDDWQFYTAEGLRRELARVLEQLVGLLAEHDAEQAIDRARRWLALDRLSEPAHRALMELYARSGQRTAALRQYRQCVQILHDELGVEPLPETVELGRAIEEGRLEPLARTEEVPAHDRGLAGEALEEARPLVGRVAELATAREALARASNGYLLAIEGEAGIGKTTLASALIGEARATGARAAEARAYLGEEGVPYAPLIPLLRAAQSASGAGHAVGPARASELGRLLPEVVSEAPAAPLDSPAAFTRFVDTLSDVLLSGVEGTPPGVLFLDDLQWADDATLDVLSYLVRRLTGRGVLVVLAWRTEDVGPEHRLRALVAERARAEAATSLSPSRLGPEDVGALVVSTGADLDLVGTLFEQTEGVPFFVVEYLRARESGQGMPEGVQALLRSRLAGLGPLASQVLTTAAVMGRSFDVDALERSAGRSQEEVVEGLEELLRRQLLVESGGAYRFDHDRMREFVYQDTAQPRRRLLHGRVADAMARGRLIDERAAVVAGHLLEAGREEEAAGWFERAGRHARGLFANAEALEHYRRALELGTSSRADLYEAIGDVQTTLGRYPEARESYGKAIAHAPDRAPNIERKLAGIELRRGDWLAADRHLAAALAAMSEEARADRAAVLADRSLAAFRMGGSEAADQLAAAALAEAETSDEPEPLAQAHNVLGILAKAKGDLDGAVGHLSRSAEIAAALEGTEARTAALNNLALATREAGRIEEARSFAEQALALVSATGDLHREAAIRNNLADLLHLAGRSQEAMEELKRAVALFAEVSSAGGEASPEIWKLVDW